MDHPVVAFDAVATDAELHRIPALGAVRAGPAVGAEDRRNAERVLRAIRVARHAARLDRIVGWHT